MHRPLKKKKEHVQKLTYMHDSTVSSLKLHPKFLGELWNITMPMGEFVERFDNYRI